MEHLHIFEAQKFTEPYIMFVNKNFNPEDHLFVIIGEANFSNNFSQKNVVSFKSVYANYPLMIKEMYHSKKIHLHGLFIPSILILLFLHPRLLKKCNWIIWGGDLYSYYANIKSKKGKAKEFVRRKVIKRIGSFTTHIRGDYELLKSLYEISGEYKYSFMYPSNLYKDYGKFHNKKLKGKVSIQVGNSADPSNNHIEIFQKIALTSNENIKIICPLSYGDKMYAEKVIESGRNFFEENFVALTDFLVFEDYMNLLSEIDVAVFNHKRQQGVGNITSLLSMQKKVYIRDDITTWDFCKEHDLKVFSINNSFNTLLDPISSEDKINNKQQMKFRFSESKLKEDWGKIFEGK
ncbi:hypothetical protein BHE17_11950 [Planococcus maritimus]|uniref:TDP-N-acetylfucosamine:lipid II N-acetylfucosaminyltransferase n=1 Tax=Planococcus maritimus TaxID=192421 RepID=UPI00084C5C98|nr:TDP-N-acetylfucosamine:lipid II N-acetylfucosaminyltransferase [Planococcus maritimus]OED33125.1 hypothetical protein BHE17_11950 [Planococcus maritimus]